MTPLPRGCGSVRCAVLTKHRGVSRAFCKYCYRHPVGNFASHMLDYGCPFYRFRVSAYIKPRSTLVSFAWEVWTNSKNILNRYSIFYSIFVFVVRSFSKLNSFCLDNYRTTINILEKFQLSYDQS